MKMCTVCKKNPIIGDSPYAWLCAECERMQIEGRPVHIEVGRREIASRELSQPFIYRVIIPDGVEVIRERAFGRAIEYVEIPDSVTRLEGREMFASSPLKHIKLGGGCKEIDYKMFSACTNLSEVILSEGLERIWSDAFYCCKALENITLPNSLLEIYRSAFEKSGIRRLVLGPKLGLVFDKAFRECVSLASVEIRSENRLEIGDEAFADCTALVSVDICGENRLEIGAKAFAGCVALENVKLSGNLEKIGSRAFDSCTALGEIYIPQSVQELGDSVFGGCKSGIRIVYEGTSDQWVTLAMPRTLRGTRTILGPYDKYPYYNSQGTHYEEYEYSVSFDRGIERIEVCCEGDGKTLIYGERR